MTQQNTDRTVSTVPDFPYTTLKTPQSFRLLQILPRQGSPKDISCTIEEYDRRSEQCPSYIALSYTWGYTKKLCSIQVNGKTVFVTFRLYMALLDLRRRMPKECIWIDALCINQENATERGHQVAQMRAIYSEARRVISWLGTAQRRNVAYLFDAIQRHHRECAPPFVASYACSSVYDQDFDEVLQYIIDKDYWRRIWIVQEIVVATKLSLMCGDSMVSWPIFANFVSLTSYGHFDGALRLHESSSGKMRLHGSTRILRLLQWKHENVSLADALDWTSECRATDARDRIYAILGLVSTGDTIEADYTLTPCALFAKVAHLLFSNLPPHLHDCARGMYWSWDTGDAIDEESEDDSDPDSDQDLQRRRGLINIHDMSINLLRRSALALASSTGCEDAALLLSIAFPGFRSMGVSIFKGFNHPLFPSYDTWVQKVLKDEDTKEPISISRGHKCALDYVLSEMVRLSRLEAGA